MNVFYIVLTCLKGGRKEEEQKAGKSLPSSVCGTEERQEEILHLTGACTYLAYFLSSYCVVQKDVMALGHHDTLVYSRR